MSVAPVNRFLLAVPWFGQAVRDAASSQRLQGLQAAAWLLARSHGRSADSSDWREWIADRAGLGADALRRFPAGPSAMASVSTAVPEGWLACVRPVHLLTAIDHLRLAPADEISLTETEALDLIGSLNRHLAGSEFRLHFIEPTHWVLESRRKIECDTVPPDLAIGTNIREAMPSGIDSKRLNAMVSELQMLLHVHPLNAKRLENGQAVVNSIWPWGFGPAVTPDAVELPELVSDDHWLRGVWRLHGGRMRGIEDLWAVTADLRGPAVIALARPPCADSAESLDALENRWLFPLKRALVAGGRGVHASMILGQRQFEFRGQAGWKSWSRRRSLEQFLA
jgi:hypothetical protein